MLPKPEPRVCAHRWGICEALSAVAVLGTCPRFADNALWLHLRCIALEIALLQLQRRGLRPHAVIGPSEHGQDARATARVSGALHLLIRRLRRRVLLPQAARGVQRGESTYHRLGL